MCPDYGVDVLFSILPVVGMVIMLGVLLWAAHWLLIKRHPDITSERKFPRQIIMLGLSLLAFVVFILALPISEGFRDRLLGLIGLLISGIIAFSSTTIIANAAAGILLRITKPFRTGDFVRVGEYFGRVSARGLFDTEIQTETRELIALPNTYLITHPVTAVLNTGTVISTTLSLGFDIHHTVIERLLMDAAGKSGLEDPFVHILEIGNYAVTYRIAGLLVDAKNLISARSNLCRCVLDTLHEAGVEIMSPTYMNQRRLDDKAKVIPPPGEKVAQTSPDDTAAAELIAFDKAERAEKIENEKQQLLKDIQENETRLKEAQGVGKERLKATLNGCRERLKAIEQMEDQAKDT
ncbi:MAG: mechanosensitive ion channel [Spartobacteria bacterium]|nr:mechanosensitive ion channel [Spartobacteria bacterium]